MVAADDPFEDLSPSEAFDVLADETRLDILEVLADHAREHPDAPALSFAELRERVGVRDSGLFNYHLQRLLGAFVRRTDGGYALRRAGRRVIARSSADGSALGTAESDAECPVCGEPDCEKSFHVHLRPPLA